MYIERAFKFNPHAGCLSNDEIDYFRVDREFELEKCAESLVDSQHNVLVYGERGVGKTFLTRLLENKIKEMDIFSFPVSVNLTGLLAYGRGYSAAAFPQAVLLQICVAIWKELFNKNYLELRENLKNAGRKLNFEDKAENTLLRLYSNLMVSSEKATDEYFSSLGMSTGIKGELKQSNRLEHLTSDILPFEFLEFVDTIINEILPKFNKTKIIVLCDEANHLPLFNQHEILERYLELFSAKSVRFFFVAGVHSFDSINELPMAFETRIKLSGFSKLEHAEEFIKKLDCKNLTCSEDAIKQVFNYFEGNPRKIYLAHQAAVDKCNERNLTEISNEIMELSCVLLKQSLDAELKHLEIQKNNSQLNSSD